MRRTHADGPTTCAAGDDEEGVGEPVRIGEPEAWGIEEVVAGALHDGVLTGSSAARGPSADTGAAHETISGTTRTAVATHSARRRCCRPSLTTLRQYGGPYVGHQSPAR